MIVIIVLAIIGVAAIGFAVWAGVGLTPRSNNLEELEARLQPVDLEGFLNLTDPDETAFLARSLAPSRFRRLQRLRVRATYHYLRAVGANAAILLRIGDLASRSEDVEVSRAGKTLLETALRTRLLVLRAGLKLVPLLIYPTEKPILRPEVLPNYEELKLCLGRLVTVQAPAMTSRSVALL